MTSVLSISSFNSYRSLDIALLLIVSLLAYFVYSRILYPAYLGPLRNLPRPKNAIMHYINYMRDCINGDPTKHLRLAQKYGPIVYLKDNLVLVNDPESKKLFSSYKFTKTQQYAAYKINGPNLLSTMDKDFHIKRKRLLSPAFTIKSLNAMESAIYKSGSQSLVEYCDSFLDNEPDREFNFYHLFSCNTLDVISELVFGTNLDTTWDEKKGLYYIEELAKTQFSLYKRVAVPFCSNIKLPMEAFFKPMIQENINNRRQSTEPHYDILQSMIDTEDPETGAKLTDEEIIDECLVLLLGGMGNTAATLTWTLYELIRNPDVLDKVASEVISNFPDLKEPISADKAKKELKYLEAAILESMRMHPAVAGSLPREVPEGGVTIDGYYLPAKTSITIDVYALHNDPTVWENPRTYDINRWLGESRETNKSKLAGFGLGTRSCVGRDLSWNELYLVLANLIRNFKFELVNKEVVPVYKFIHRPIDKNLGVKLTRRSKQN